MQFFLFVPVFDALKVRRLQYKAASNYNSGRLPLLEKIYITFKILFENIIKILSQAPVILVVILLLFFTVALSVGLRSVENFVENREKIIELQTTLKQLELRYKVAELHIDSLNYKTKETSLTVKFFDSAAGDLSDNSQSITIKGNDIYFDALVLNFDYSEIAGGEKHNLVIPYRIFSNLVPQSEGILLNLKDKNGIPMIFKRKDDNIYGLPSEKFKDNLKLFAELFTNEKKAREYGVRSAYGNAVHKLVRKGQTITIWVEQTGGLVIKNKRDF